MKNLVISFEGIPGAGKSTLVRNMQNYMSSNGLSAVSIRELDLIDHEKSSFMKAVMDTFSFSEDRYFRQIDSYIDTYFAQAVRYLICKEVIDKSRIKYDFILEDRGVDTYLSYALAGLKMVHGVSFDESLQYCWKMNSVINEVADITIRLRDTVENCVERSIKRGESSVKAKDIDFVRHVNSAYDYLDKVFSERIISVEVNGRNPQQILDCCLIILRDRGII